MLCVYGCMLNQGAHLVVRACGSWNGDALNVPILGLNLFTDVVHDVCVLLIIQKLISSHL